jgi:hypothetical protein
LEIKEKRTRSIVEKPTGFITSQNSKLSNDVDATFSYIEHLNKTMTMSEGDANSDSVMEIFEPFIHDGFVSLKNDLSDATPIKILRDTGSSQSIYFIDGYFAVFE